MKFMGSSVAPLALVAIVLAAQHMLVSRGVDATTQFAIYRMQQYEMPQGSHFGSRQNVFSMPALAYHPSMVNVSRSTSNSAASSSSSPQQPSFISSRCVLVRIEDFSMDIYRSFVAQYVGAILLVVPEHFTAAHQRLFHSFESQLLREDVKVPVYFVVDTPAFRDFHSQIDTSVSSSSAAGTATATDRSQQSAFQLLADSVLSNSFQFVVNAPTSAPIAHTANEFQAVNLQAKLNGLMHASLDSSSVPPNLQKMPTILITAHYDSLGMATALSNGCDSNGSGVVALLELTRILSILYSNAKTIPPFNFVFLLTGYGKFNYFGLKKWIEEQSDSANEIMGNIDLDEIALAISLDGLARSPISPKSALHMHVSKPPKEGQAAYEFLKKLEAEANKANSTLNLVHKKINLASEFLAWEHERFSLSKIPAMTLSHFASFKEADRTTMTDTIDLADKEVLTNNIRLIERALVHFIYKKESVAEKLLEDSLNVSDKFVESWLELICSMPRSAQLLNKNHPLIANLFAHFQRYLQEAVKVPIRVQPKTPEIVFYNQERAILIINSVKPAVFDFFLAMLIAAYMGLIYLFVINFTRTMDTFHSIIGGIQHSTNSKSKST